MEMSVGSVNGPAKKLIPIGNVLVWSKPAGTVTSGYPAIAAGPAPEVGSVGLSPVCRVVNQAGPAVGARSASRWLSASAVSMAVRAAVVAGGLACGGGGGGRGAL